MKLTKFWLTQQGIFEKRLFESYIRQKCPDSNFPTMIDQSLVEKGEGRVES